MEQKPRVDPLKGKPPYHEEGEPATLDEDPAQFYPTGGAGLLDPEDDAERDAGELPPPDTGPAKLERP